MATITVDLIKDIIFSVIAVIYNLIKSLICAVLPKRDKDVCSDIVLVTGAGSGIGRLVAVHFSQLGSTVVLWDSNQKRNLETARMIDSFGGAEYAYTCDLCSKDDIYATAEKVKKEVGKVTILINNAGICSGKQLLDSSDHMIEKTFGVNILAHFWTVKKFLPDMLKMGKGHIVTIASMAGFVGVNQLVDYSSSKFAAVGFNETLTAELRANGFNGKIHTTVVCPYIINTGMITCCDSRFFTILSPENVSATIVKSIRTNAEIVLIPSYMSYFLVLKAVLPVSVFNCINDLLVSVSEKKPLQERLLTSKSSIETSSR